ncbi:MFS transporter [Levilactobacillus suantsaii]|uniref:MFS transporter n=1 Tax=Levilactobacillus suantsaii TaxID=2292255 RepID=A0A4Q0VGH6_9LACO|nr:MFS transporter [Levilactobacillus suantsaii]QMU08468.1 MFS transporter [Levilactobacillus suantsaii]RXI76438.1 MFS transporter [Levilactobacillus suantsaii]
MFYLAMGISKYSQTLYFQQNGKLINFSLSYSVMAITGSLSFLLSNKMIGIELRRVARILGILYATGMALRVFYQNSFIAIISGGVAGIGASILLLVIRKWIYAEADENPSDKQVLISSRYTLMQITSLIATLIAGLILFIFSARNEVYVTILIVSALAILFLPTTSIPENKSIQLEQKESIIALPKNKRIGIGFLLTVILMGITTSIVDPIAPAVLRSVGYSVGSTSVVVTILGLVSMLSVFIFQIPLFNKKPDSYFLLTELIAGIIIILCGLENSNPHLWILVAFFVMSIEGTGFFILKELVEYDMLPKEEITLYLSLAQSGFLIGNAIGAPLGTLLFQTMNGQYLLVIYGLMAIVCGILYKILATSFTKHRI